MHDPDKVEFVLAADLGGTNARVAAVARDGTILRSSRGPTPSSGSSEEIVAALVRLADETSGDGPRPLAFGLAVPALVDAGSGLIISSPNLPQMNGLQLCQAIRTACGIPAVLENDANAAAVGENWLGASRDVESSICVTLGTGVGGGLILGGKVWRGIDGTAAEIGHICVEPDGVSCGCGSRGCVEQYASATAVVRIATELRPAFPATLLPAVNGITARDVYEAAVKRDALAREVFRRFGTYLGIALAGLVNTLNPETIVIGGGAAAGWDMFISHTRSEIDKRAFRRPAERVKLVPALLGDTAGILGSARLALDALSGESAIVRE